MHEVFFISLDIGRILNRKKSDYLEMKVCGGLYIFMVCQDLLFCRKATAKAYVSNIVKHGLAFP